ncbi:MAG: septal ring lytic transglycosylase RlpA family protein [Thermodesulfobacteriota bacterium]|nr:septal ring lytic transglycosylase RlpA family protein [Thermodesulfobacteriota bacterium]
MSVSPLSRTLSCRPVPPTTQRPYKINGRTYYPLPNSHGFSQEGIASWYGRKFHGRKTSNGEIYDMYGLTAAHKTLPMNTYVLVKNLENGYETTVRINDRGPFVNGRIIDLTLTGAKKLDMCEKGVAKVRITAMGEAASYREGGKIVKRFLPHKDFQTGEFYVQIGSFTDRANAERLKDTMYDQDHKTIIRMYDRGDKIFYRVRVEAGNSLAEAERMERVLDRAGFEEAFVVAR